MQPKTERRDIHGVVLLDKPLGVSSNHALQTVKRLYRARKAGHTGSLDPLATGVLPICLGEATKVSSFLLADDKQYQVTVQLGVTTATLDAEGRVLAQRPVPVLSEARLTACLQAFIGDQMQVPPMYSALKRDGKKLYQLARQGQTVEREPRPVRIEQLTLVAWGEDWLELAVHCSKGTYIRTLVDDIGQALGCGAHVKALRRTAVGEFTLAHSVTIETLAEGGDAALGQALLPVDAVLTAMPAVTLPDNLAAKVRCGQLVVFDVPAAVGWVRLYSASSALLGLGEISADGKIQPKRVFNF
ncbi:MAG: tRNA pseudouridine(55) synthase TruB [Methylococcales bacterium]|nr:tRNA pseudouridine(55) synthase TruB [Methylococcales bacterium]